MNWRVIPGIGAVALAPILYGAANPGGQAVVGFLLALSVFLLRGQAPGVRPVLPGWLRWVLLLILVLPVIPMPRVMIERVSPGQAHLAEAAATGTVEASSWGVLSVSAAETIQRIWEIGLYVAAVFVFRRAARLPMGGRLMAWAFCFVVLVEAYVEWTGADTGQRTIFGLWTTTWGRGAGTFANRNHYADWLVVSGLFVMGWALKHIAPFGAERTDKMRASVGPQAEVWLLAFIGIGGFVLAFASGSRGGAIALGGGLAALFALVLLRSRRRRRMSGMMAWLLPLSLILIFAGGVFWNRLAQMAREAEPGFSRQFIWNETIRMLPEFPLAGSGWGTFNRVFDHFKTTAGERTILYAENETLQLGLEGGLIGFVAVCLGLGFALRRLFEGGVRGRAREPEMLIGLLAGLIAWLSHSLVEFVFQVPATGLLASALFGFGLGLKDEDRSAGPAGSVAWPRIRAGIAASVLAGISICQGDHHGGAVIISHDRYLLDRVCHRIVEMDRGRTKSYSGNYSRYVESRERELLTAERQYEKDAAFIEKERSFIAKHLAGQRSKEAQGRRTRLERMLSDGEFVTEQAAARKTVRLKFDDVETREGEVVRMEELGMAFGANHLFNNLTMQIRGGDRLGITGPNGAGKSTLLKILLGELPATSGEVQWDRRRSIGYYAQESAKLDPSRTVIDEIRTGRSELSEQMARSILGSFRFTGGDVFKNIGLLSGGEQSRLRLATLILSAPEVLVLDEPTNHLDIPSREVLETALSSFGGTIIVVSHDRYFLDQIVNRLLVMRPTGHRVYAGNYSYYLEETEREQYASVRPRAESPSGKKGKTKSTNNKEEAKPARRTAEFDLLSVEEIEARIVEHETKLAEMHERFGDPDVYKKPDALEELEDEMALFTDELERLNEAWAERLETQ